MKIQTRASMMALSAVSLFTPTIASAQYQCPAPGAEVELLRLSRGGYVVFAQVRELELQLPEVRSATIAINGQDVADVQLAYANVAYACCCPSELLGQASHVLPAGLPAGTSIDVTLGREGVFTLVIPGVLISDRSGVHRSVDLDPAGSLDGGSDSGRRSGEGVSASDHVQTQQRHQHTGSVPR